MERRRALYEFVAVTGLPRTFGFLKVAVAGLPRTFGFLKVAVAGIPRTCGFVKVAVAWLSLTLGVFNNQLTFIFVRSSSVPEAGGRLVHFGEPLHNSHKRGVKPASSQDNKSQ